jgi:cell division protein FtsQ
MRRLPRWLPVPRVRLPRRFVAGALLVTVLLVPGWMLLRDSAIVGVDEVVITGVSGPQAAQIEQALTDAAERMTTMNVDEQALRDAVAQFPVVAGVSADGKLLHRLDIAVTQHEAVGALANGDQRMAVAADGTVLEGTLTKDLPLVPVSSPPGGRVVSEPDALKLVSLLGAAPAELRARVGRVEVTDTGLVAHVTDGPQLYFGPAAQLRAKWLAATRVLADVTSRGATYVDVRVPERPAAGGLEETATAVAPVDPQLPVETLQ